MVRWVSLEPGWKLQNVQAGLNVIIAFICAGGIFVLVRYCWLLAARQVTREKDVPATALLSLNTIGETVDLIWLMRKDLLSRRYTGLLLQCISVILLTIAALMSGFIARFSTRYGTIVLDRSVNGTLAQRSTTSIQYAEVDTNATLYSLKTAHFPQDQLLEYMPNLDHHWEYDSTQWNSSWSLDCKYNNSIEIPNVVSTGNCSNPITTEIPQIADNWVDWPSDAWSIEWTAWRNNYTTYRDVLIFSHGLETGEFDSSLNDTMTSGRVRTVVIHLEGVPCNTSQTTGCYFAPGPVQRASYTSMTCKMNRSVSNRTWEEAYWGACPDGYDISMQTSAYVQHYANNFRKQSSRELPITPFTGQELVLFYQAYLITKDTSVTPYVQRIVSEYVEVTQISIVTLIVCCVATAVILFGLINYWIFLFRHWNHMRKTPQSKLDWMLKTLRKDGEDSPHSGSMRQKLKDAMASGRHGGESVPLNKMTPSSQASDRKRPRSTASSTIEFPTPELERGDDGFETPILGSNFSGSRPGVTWFPQGQQYQRIGGGAQVGQTPYGLGLNYGRNSNTQYSPAAPVQSRFEDSRTSQVWVGTHHVDTIYDPGRW